MKEVTENVKLYSIEESCFFSLVCLDLLETPTTKIFLIFLIHNNP